MTVDASHLYLGTPTMSTPEGIRHIQLVTWLSLDILEVVAAFFEICLRLVLLRAFLKRLLEIQDLRIRDVWTPEQATKECRSRTIEADPFYSSSLRSFPYPRSRSQPCPLLNVHPHPSRSTC